MTIYRIQAIIVERIDGELQTLFDIDSVKTRKQILSFMGVYVHLALENQGISGAEYTPNQGSKPNEYVTANLKIPEGAGFSRAIFVDDTVEFSFSDDTISRRYVLNHFKLRKM